MRPREIRARDLTNPKSRAFSLRESLDLAMTEAEALGVRPKFQRIERGGSSAISTVVCRSNDPALKISFVGGGSGFDPIEAEVKAIYEALEWNLQHRITGLVSADTDWTGLATGANADEARLHGLYEWIERDAYSLFLLRSIVNPVPRRPRLIRRDSLPDRFARAVREIEEDGKDELVLVDLTSDFAIPSFLISFARRPVLVQPLGFGASLSKDEAFGQALLEAVQADDRHRPETEEHRRSQMATLGDRPVLAKAFRCSLHNFAGGENVEFTDWQDLASCDEPLRLQEQIALVETRLAARGHLATNRIYYEGATGLSLAHTVVLGLETFYRIKEGRFSTLTARGLEALQ